MSHTSKQNDYVRIAATEGAGQCNAFTQDTLLHKAVDIKRLEDMKENTSVITYTNI